MQKPDNSGYEQIFGEPFWRRVATPLVHAFVTDVIVMENEVQLQLELLLAASFDKEFSRYNDDPVGMFASLETSPAIIESDVQAALALFEKDSVEALEGSWRTFSLDKNQGGERSIRLLSTLADPEGVAFGIIQSDSTPSPVLQSLSGNLGTLATPSDIVKVLEQFSNQNLEVAVLDVGQGAASFLFNNSFLPDVYFDLGGGIWKNFNTFPAHGVKWCFTKNPPVILSHWHWDHWAGATYGGIVNVTKAMNTLWICPDQPTGWHTKKFQAKILSGRGRILLWPTPTVLPPITSGNITIGRAAGPDKNNSGLIVLVESPAKRFSLLLGDAAYEHVPPAISNKYANGGLRTLVIAHHGGKITGNLPLTIPRPDGCNPNVAVYSAGNGNSYSHPSTVHDHQVAGWQTVIGTDSRIVGNPARHLYAHTGGLSGGTISPACRGGSCSLTLHK